MPERNEEAIALALSEAHALLPSVALGVELRAMLVEIVKVLTGRVQGEANS